MSLYTVKIEDRIYKIRISGKRCTVNGEDVDVRMLPLNDHGLHLIQQGSQAYEVFLSTQESNTYSMHLFGGRRIVGRIASADGKRSTPSENSSSVLRAPMHGLVVDIAVGEGDEVEKGQTLVVLESMKMQMQLRSPRRGKVARVTAQAGDQVEKGALLVQFESAEEC